MNTRIQSLPRGFSLLEVLIAVAILAFGLLAITSLQASLVRNSADAKSRSTALSVAKDRIEDLRAYRTMADYFAMTDTVTPTTVTVGNFTYTVSTVVQRYGFNSDPDNDGDKDDAAFLEITNDTAEDPAGNFVSENEFKRVAVTVGWTDSAGQAQTVVIEDAIGAVAPENTGKLARRNPDAADRKPQILITNPSNEAGVIPIAIGDGSETAATNPRPEVISGNVIGTTFDVFTFAALNNSANALAQSRVENFIIGCECDKTRADQDEVDYRPTYWDGTRYVAPDEATGYSVQAGESNNPPLQSVLCRACCRDHHDPNNVAGAKFSPRLDVPHEHYALNSLGSPSPNKYIEACRMIRVDGIHRVAADPYNEYTNILRTAIKSGEQDYFTDTFPDDTASDRYVDFVIDYLETQGLQNNPNTQLTQAVADQKASQASLDETTQSVEQNEIRWLHARGLYIDWLEPDAIDAISESQADCQEPLTASECLLRVLPFTSINVTELSTWSAGSTAFQVENNSFISSLTNPNPARGKLVAYNVGQAANATAKIRTSTSGLLANDSREINPHDKLVNPTVSTRNILDQPDDDAQAFEVVGPTPPACGALTATSTPIAKNNFHPFASTASCAGSDSSKPLASTVIRLTVGTGAGPATSRLELVAPDGTVYTVPTGNTSERTWAQIPGVYDLAAAGVPTMAGTWTLRVYNFQNQATSATVSFSVQFLYTSGFTLQLTDYTFQSNFQNLPTFGMNPTGTCQFKAPVAPSTTVINPITCTATQAGVSTVFTMQKYNYGYSDFTPSQPVTCQRGNTNNTVSCSVNTRTLCRNYSVQSVTVNGGTPVLPDSFANDGKVGETTQFTVPTLPQDASIIVDMQEDAPSVASCKVPGNGQCVVTFNSCP